MIDNFFLDIPPNSIRAKCTPSGKAFGAVSWAASFTSFCLFSSDVVFCKMNDGLQNMLLFSRYGAYLLKVDVIHKPGDVFIVVMSMLLGAYFLGLISPHLMVLLNARVSAATIYNTINRVGVEPLCEVC